MVLRGLVLDAAVLSRSDGGGEGGVPLDLVLLCPFLPLDTPVFSRLTVEGGAWSYGVRYRCAPSLPRYCCMLSFDGGAENTALRGLVLLCPLPPSRYGCIRSF